MNRKVAAKLTTNPHYKLSAKQKKELEEYEGEQKKNNPLVTFGKIPTHPHLEKKGY